MFCPKCGNSVENGNEVCLNCGLDLSSVEQESEIVEEISASEDVLPVEASHSKVPVKKLVYFGLAIVVFIMFFVAAGNIVDGGSEIMQIQSVGGKTLEEAYYQELGSIYAGYAMISRALGIFFASVLVWMGLKD